MTFRISTASKTAAAQALADRIDAGTGPGTLKIYTGAMPATPETALSNQVLLGTLTLSDPCGTVANGVITFNPITQDNAADATGDAAWFQLLDSDGVVRADGDITDTNGAGVLKLNTVHIYAGGPIQISSMQIQVG